MTMRKIHEDKNLATNRYGDEAPKLKHFLIVIIALAVLMVLAKVAYVLFNF